MDIALDVGGQMLIEHVSQQEWKGDSPEIMQVARFAGREMMVIQQSDETPDLYELQYLGFVTGNIKGIETAKSLAPEFAKKVLSQLSDMIIDCTEDQEWKSGDSCVHDCISGTLIIERDGWYFKPHGMMRVFQVSEDRIKRPLFDEL